MKRILRLSIIISIVCICFLFTNIFANTYTVNDNVTLGKYNIYFRNGASYVRYRGIGQHNWMYFYRDYNNVEHKAFCLNLGLAGAEEGDYIVDANRLINDPKVASILISGSPYKTLSELGLNNEDEATFATQFAVWVYLNNLDLNLIGPYSSGNENVVNAIKKIYYDGMNMEYNAESIINIDKVGKVDIDNLDRQYYSQKFKINSNSNIQEVKLTTSGINNVKITDLNNNVVNNITNLKEFKILIPRTSIEKNKTLSLNFCVKAKQTSVMFGATTINDRQNMGLLLNPVSLKDIKENIDIEYKPAKIELKKIDKDTGIGIKGVKFRFETLEGTHLGDFITNENGIINIDAEKDLNINKEQQIKITEIEVPDNYYIDKNNCSKIIDIKYGETAFLELQNEKIKGKLKVIKLSCNDNKYTSILAKMPLKNVTFEVYDINNKLVDTITTDEKGIAITKDLLKGIYKLKEIKQAKYYLLNEKIFEIEIKSHNEIIEQVIYNESVNIDIEIKKKGFIETQNKDNIYYTFKNIHNKSNVPLDNFTWNDLLPTNAVRLDKIYTGTYNEDLDYSVWYKTNKNDFRLYKDRLNSQVVYALNFNNIILDSDEYITEFEFRFGTVKVDFHEIENPIVYVNVLDNLKNGFIFTNSTKISGNYLEKYIEDKDNWSTIIYTKELILKKELPKTGY